MPQAACLNPVHDYSMERKMELEKNTLQGLAEEAVYEKNCIQHSINTRKSYIESNQTGRGEMFLRVN